MADHDDDYLQSLADAAKDEYYHGVSMDEAKEEIAELQATRARMMRLFARFVTSARDVVTARDLAVSLGVVECWPNWYTMIGEEIAEIEQVLREYDKEMRS